MPNINSNEENEFTYFGFYRAKVVDPKDPKLLGRVKVWIPDIMPQSDLIDPITKGLWAHPASSPMGGRNIPDGKVLLPDESWYQGCSYIPPKGSWVWIFFEKGDPNYPYYFASADFGQVKTLPENQLGGAYWKKWVVLKSREGRTIVVSDDVDDCRVEITGKKRLITNPVNGDIGSVYPIEENQTVILLDERPGFEKLLIKDHHGNFFNWRIDDKGITDQLHVYFKKDIHIQSDTNIFVKTLGSFHLETGVDFLLHSKRDIHIKADVKMKEMANVIYRFAIDKDCRYAGTYIKDHAAQEITRKAGVSIADVAGTKISRYTPGDIHDAAENNMYVTAGQVLNLKALAAVCLEGEQCVNLLCSGGPLNLVAAGANVTIQEAAASAESADMYDAVVDTSIAKLATPAAPIGTRDQPVIPVVAPDPPIVPEHKTPTPIIRPAIVPTDDYDLTIKFKSMIAEYSPVMTTILQGFTPETIPTTTTPLGTEPFIPGISAFPRSKSLKDGVVNTSLVGVGHIFTISMKDEYRDQIIPLIKASGGNCTGMYLLRDLDPGADKQYLDDVSVWNNYRNLTDWDDWNPIWWERFENFLSQAKENNITVIPSLFDFVESPFNPFVTKIPNPWTTNFWSPPLELYVSRMMEYIKNSGVNYIINLGVKSYNHNVKESKDLLPSPGFIRKLVYYLVDTLKVPSNKLALTASVNRNLFEMNPLVRYKVLTGEHKPQHNELNNEEYVAGHWGGSATVNDYVDFLKSSKNGVVCMNTWKMSEFDDGSHDMNKIFHPNGREAIRRVILNGL